MRLTPLLKGISTYLPGLSGGIPRRREHTEGTGSARYCYSIWLRHLVMAHQNQLATQFDVAAELGPGTSLGVGLAALLSGTHKHYSLDIVEYATDERNLKVFDELVELFHERARIPDQTEFPEAKPHLSSYEFPRHILTEERLQRALERRRIDSIRKALLSGSGGRGGDTQLFYFAPWNDSQIIQEASVDMIYSQAVLEHVDDLDATYEALARWLKPHGFLSCQIDFKCHETATEWNGHWTYSDLVWKLIRGRRPYLLNREPLSTHLEFLKKHGFATLCQQKVEKPSRIQRDQLAPRFKNLRDQDLTVSGVFIQAIKRI